MKKMAAFLLLTVLLCGCARNRLPDGPLCRVVTHIHVAYTIDGHTETKTYTEPKQMESILNYLRLLKKGNKADIDPDSFRSDSFDITLFYSDGQQNTFRQLHDQLLQADGGPWLKIETEKMELLFP